MFEINIIAMTREIDNVGDNINIRREFDVLSGKAAGMCYAPDDYMENGINNEEAALRRCKFNSKSGHYSVFEHAHLTMVIKCSKAFAMILNSTRLYTTSEKSARYTKMQLTSVEQEKYDYWKDAVADLIKLYYPNYTEKDVEKLAMENARYMTSVFTPTSMVFTIPYARLAMLPNWLRKEAAMIDNMVSSRGNSSPIIDNYYIPLKEECLEAAIKIDTMLCSSNQEPILSDHKNIKGITLLTFLNGIDEYYGDVYVSRYEASFAAIAQLQRHRTCNLSIQNIQSGTDTLECYIPKIIKGTPLQEKWVEDFNSLVENGIVPQATIMSVIEKGFFEDFVLKCKERLCCRTQLESAVIVENQLVRFYKDDKLSDPENKKVIDSMIYYNPHDDNISAKYRCKFDGYTCKEPCSRITKSNLRYI